LNNFPLQTNLFTHNASQPVTEYHNHDWKLKCAGDSFFSTFFSVSSVHSSHGIHSSSSQVSESGSIHGKSLSSSGSGSIDTQSSQCISIELLGIIVIF
jgi:hypothetical protein